MISQLRGRKRLPSYRMLMRCCRLGNNKIVPGLILILFRFKTLIKNQAVDHLKNESPKYKIVEVVVVTLQAIKYKAKQ